MSADPATTGLPGQLPRIRSALDELVSFRQSEPIRSPEGHYFPLAANESPHEPLPAVVRAIHEAALGVNRYPDNACADLISEISARLAVPEDDIAVGCGSVGVAQMLLEAVAEPGAEVLYAWRSFEAYPILTRLAGATPVEVALKDGTHDLDAMAEAITDRTRLVFVCNPNNPTGTVLHRPELEAFLDRVPADCLVVVDEAYREYVRDDGVPDGLTLRPGRPNVVVLRTFSKAYGLAGLRVGFAVGHPAVADALRKACPPFSVNGVAQAAAIAALRAQDAMTARVESTVKERERVHHTLAEQGWHTTPSSANFLWLDLGDGTGDFAGHCASAGVALRPFAGEGVRVSIGSSAENDAFLAAAASFRRTRG
ncbi:histidinol-phosphate transaminase [Streptomyces sp. BPPL-273]|uniref:histidinol-phosphate transaminase n=1 Tax=Streptomyces TaxID=1883 RepID=UPI0024AFBA7D|nr:histidinol-phosphate transaminase [Streptomyces sp. BPPL-273]WHM28626.1 histidinol-phosphate transaminase [Streptomyces sp. BPPL-273]